MSARPADAEAAADLDAAEGEAECERAIAAFAQQINARPPPPEE